MTLTMAWRVLSCDDDYETRKTYELDIQVAGVARLQMNQRKPKLGLPASARAAAGRTAATKAATTAKATSTPAAEAGRTAFDFHLPRRAISMAIVVGAVATTFFHQNLAAVARRGVDQRSGDLGARRVLALRTE